MNDKKLKCPKCGYEQTIDQWLKGAIYDFDGKISSIQEYQLEELKFPTRGDHARCPNCAELLHIDSDLLG